MRQLGIEMIAVYSPQARGRSDRAFGTHQGRLPKELALYGITTMEAANRYPAEAYLPACNAEFMQPAARGRISLCTLHLDDILCEQYERTVTADNCVSFERKPLQIPANRYRCHYVRVRVRVHRYTDGSPAVFHGPRNWPIMTHRENKRHQRKGRQRKSTARHVLRKAASVYDSLSFSNRDKEKNPIC